MLDGGHHGEGENDERDVAVPAMLDLVLLWSSLNSFLAVSKLSSIAHRCPSTPTSVSTEVSAGHHVLRLARSPSVM